MSEYLPMHERSRRASVKRYIRELERDCWREIARNRRRLLAAQIRQLKKQLPPYLVWRNDLSCHECILVEGGRDPVL